MKSRLVVLCMLLGMASVAGAQELTAPVPQPLSEQVTPIPDAASAPTISTSSGLSVSEAARPADSLFAKADNPQQSPFPSQVPGSGPNPYCLVGEECRWELGMGYRFVRFNSSRVKTSVNGVGTMFSYFFNRWIGVDGDFTAAWGSTHNVSTQYAFYGAGPVITARFHRFEPRAHAVFGGVRTVPRLAGLSQNSLGMEFGGGVDYRWLEHLSFRVMGDYVRTRLYSQSQNNFQLTGGFVIHF